MTIVCTPEAVGPVILKPCKTCGGQALVRTNGRTLGYCSEHLPTKAVPVGTIKQHAGRLRVKTEHDGWQLCTPDGQLLSEADPWIAGRLSDVLAKYGDLLATMIADQKAPRVADPTHLLPAQAKALQGIVAGKERGVTDFELGMWPPTAAKRRLELQRAGLVEVCGWGRSPRGRKCRLSRATLAGIDAWRAL